MAKRMKRKSREVMKVGARVILVENASNGTGVIVHEHKDGNLFFEDGRPWSVHWSNGKRGKYCSDQLKRDKPKGSLKKEILKEVEEDSK